MCVLLFWCLLPFFLRGVCHSYLSVPQELRQRLENLQRERKGLEGSGPPSSDALQRECQGCKSSGPPPTERLQSGQVGPEATGAPVSDRVPPECDGPEARGVLQHVAEHWVPKMTAMGFAEAAVRHELSTEPMCQSVEELVSRMVERPASAGTAPDAHFANSVSIEHSQPFSSLPHLHGRRLGWACRSDCRRISKFHAAPALSTSCTIGVRDSLSLRAEGAEPQPLESLPFVVEVWSGIFPVGATSIIGPTSSRQKAAHWTFQSLGTRGVGLQLRRVRQTSGGGISHPLSLGWGRGEVTCRGAGPLAVGDSSSDEGSLLDKEECIPHLLVCACVWG